jgi:hypothetical protein
MIPFLSGIGAYEVATKVTPQIANETAEKKTSIEEDQA